MKFIRAYYKTFENHGRCEKGLLKRKWQPILLKMEFLESKSLKKNEELNYLETGF